MNGPFVSVVIPITRYEFEFEESLSSVLSQSYTNFEIVIVDNNATPAAREIANQWFSKLPDKIRIVQEKNPGLVSARNQGIKSSKGNYIALLDSDDRMHPDRLKIQLNAMEESSSVVLVGAWTDEISPDGRTVISRNSNPRIPRWANILFGQEDRWKKDPFFEPRPSTFMFRRETALKIGLFDPRFDPFWLEDTDFAFRMYQEGRVAIIPQSLVEYRTHPESDSLRRIFDFGLIRKHDLFFSILRDKFYRKEDPKSRRAFSRLQSRWMRETGIKLLAMKNGEPFGRRLVNIALSRDPFDPQTLEAAVRLHLPRRFYPRAFGIRGPVDFSLPSDVDEAFIEALFSL